MTKKELRAYKWAREQFYQRKYKTLFKKTIEFEGLEIYEANYIMDNLFHGKQLAAFNLNANKEINGLLGFGVFATEAFGMYRQPISVRIIKENNSPFIPDKPLTIHKDVAILDTNHNPYWMIQQLIKQLIEVDITINQNIKTHRMPFMVQTTDDKTLNAIEDAIEGNTIIEVGAEVIQVLNTQTPYLIDDLHRYRVELEHEILTILGIDNVKHEKGAQMNNDEVNANNDEINVFKSSVVQNMELWFEEINELFGVEISIKKNTHLGEDDYYYDEVSESDMEVDNNETEN